MASKVRRFLFWKVALYYGVLIALLLVLVGVIQPEWLKYLPVGGLEGLSNSTEATAEYVFSGILAGCVIGFAIAGSGSSPSPFGL